MKQVFTTVILQTDPRITQFVFLGDCCSACIAKLGSPYSTLVKQKYEHPKLVTEQPVWKESLERLPAWKGLPIPKLAEYRFPQPDAIPRHQNPQVRFCQLRKAHFLSSGYEPSSETVSRYGSVITYGHLEHGSFIGVLRTTYWRLNYWEREDKPSSFVSRGTCRLYIIRESRTIRIKFILHGRRITKPSPHGSRTWQELHSCRRCRMLVAEFVSVRRGSMTYEMERLTQARHHSCTISGASAPRIRVLSRGS